MSSSSQLTRNCLTFEERPGTPEHLKKYRKSSYLEPGKRYQHPGVHDDYPSLNLESKIFGAVDPLTRDGASDLIHLPTPSEAKKLDQYKKELTYKSTFREPLGKTLQRPGVFPPNNYSSYEEKIISNNKKNLEDENLVKNLIFPQTSLEYTTNSPYSPSELYKKTHNDYDPGEQKKRNYDWNSLNINPSTNIFGKKSDTVAFNGVSTSIKEILNSNYEDDKNPKADEGKIISSLSHENFRNYSTNILGQSKNLGQDSGLRSKDMIYGKSSGKKNITVAEILRGCPSSSAIAAMNASASRPNSSFSRPDTSNSSSPTSPSSSMRRQDDRPSLSNTHPYSNSHSAPYSSMNDPDLGKSIMPGFRNISHPNRVYGIPSIRHDLKRPNSNSLSDGQNYGEDITARDLINPLAFSNMSIDPLAMSRFYGRDKMKELFGRIGYDLSDELFDYLFRQALEKENSIDSCSINTFRDVLNDYLIREKN